MHVMKKSQQEVSYLQGTLLLVLGTSVHSHFQWGLRASGNPPDPRVHDLEGVRAVHWGSFCRRSPGADEAVSTTRGSLPHHALVDVPSVEPLRAERRNKLASECPIVPNLSTTSLNPDVRSCPVSVVVKSQVEIAVPASTYPLVLSVGLPWSSRRTPFSLPRSHCSPRSVWRMPSPQ